MGVQIEIDQASQERLNKQFDHLKMIMGKSSIAALAKIGMKIKTTAQNRIKAKGHIVTSRLRNSIYVKGKKPIINNNNQRSYSDSKGNAYTSDLSTTGLVKDQIAVGTNVDYAEKIEVMDSFLYWAVKNVDVTKTIGEQMREDLKRKK
ncbi:MAG: hypothetical protein GWP06_02225 [Actinobacteria bacterium]|nr:hypothetical protein [Actinomycetota bacterium]